MHKLFLLCLMEYIRESVNHGGLQADLKGTEPPQGKSIFCCRIDSLYILLLKGYPIAENQSTSFEYSLKASHSARPNLQQQLLHRLYTGPHMGTTGNIFIYI